MRERLRKFKDRFTNWGEPRGSSHRSLLPNSSGSQPAPSPATSPAPEPSRPITTGSLTSSHFNQHEQLTGNERASCDSWHADETLSNLWIKAEESLRKDPTQEKRDLIDRYFDIMRSELGTDEAADVASHLNEKMEELDQRRMKITWGSHEADIEAVFNNTARHIMTAKDVITSAASSDPHAALACAGGLVLLTLLIRPVEQREQLLGGLELTSSIIARHSAFDPRSRISRSGSHVEHDTESNLVKLYAKILELQARALCYVQRGRLSQFIRDMFRGNTWKTLVSDIKDLDPRSREPGRLVFQERVHQFLDSVETQQRHELDDKIRERRTILLKSLDVCPYEDRKDINADRAPGTCEWFTQHEHFRAWESAHRPGLLWVSADPGCGKSVLSKFLVNVVLPKSGTTVSYFFFKDDFEDQKSAASAMCAIIRQLLQRHDGLMDDALLKMFETSERSLLLSFNRLFKILVHISSLCEENVVCVLDALDECQDYDRRPLMAELAKLYTNNPIGLNLKFLITSRGYRDIQRAFQKLENGVPTIHLKGEDDQQVQRISAEINTFISSRLDDLTESLGLQFSERQYLEKRLTKAKNRTYLWATLALDVVENILSITEASFQQALDNIPDGLDYLYDKILSRSENSEMARKIIHVILAAQTPLTVSEMSVAFAIGSGHREYSKIHLEPEDRFITTLRATCGLFISIVDKKVYFLHQTAREFLLSSRSETATKHALQPTGYNWKHTFTSTSSHAVLAWICVRLRIFDAKISDPSQRLPLGQYAFINWAAHCEQAFPSTHDDLWQIAASLCQMICDGDIHTSLCGEVPQLETPLLLAVFFGLEGAAQHILEKTPDALYHRDKRGTTPLYYAAGLGRTKMVRNLLEASSEEHYTNSVINNTNGGDTPLAAAMRRGHAETARALLADSRTRLHVPIITEVETNSFEDVIDLSDPPSILALLEDTRWRTELTTVELLALYKKTLVQGHLKHARDLVCNFGSRFNGLLDFTLDVLKTSHTLGNNLPDIIPVLRGINAQLDMDSRQTRKKKSHAVWYAASIGKFPEILEYLVDDAGFQPDTEGPDHNTPLFVCALHGYSEGIKILLKTGKVRVNFQNMALSTPLMAACGPATSRLEGTDRYLPADLLLSQGADPKMRNYNGRTALYYAEKNGNEMVRTLLCAKGLEDVAEEMAEDAAKDDGDIVTLHSALQSTMTVSANIKPYGFGSDSVLDVRPNASAVHESAFRHTWLDRDPLLDWGNIDDNTDDIPTDSTVAASTRALSTVSSWSQSFD